MLYSYHTTACMPLTLSGRLSYLYDSRASASARAPALMNKATIALAALSVTVRWGGLVLKPKSAAASNVLVPHARCQSLRRSRSRHRAGIEVSWATQGL